MDNDALIDAHGVSAGYGQAPAIVEIDISVRRGEVVVLLGPNGAGKTTTIRALIGELPLSSGEVQWRGQRVRMKPHRLVRQGLAYVPEERSVFAALTTRENLSLGQGGVDDALDHFPELKPILNRKAGLLSGGEQQMLTLARALAAKPDLLIVDELSLGLAPLIVERLMRALIDATASGIGVLLVEQHVRQALRIANRGYVLRRGHVIMQGAAAELTENLAALEASYLSAPVPAPPSGATSPETAGAADRNLSEMNL